MTRTPISKKLIAFIAAHPGCTESEISEGIDRPIEAVRGSISNNNKRHPGLIETTLIHNETGPLVRYRIAIDIPNPETLVGTRFTTDPEKDAALHVVHAIAAQPTARNELSAAISALFDVIAKQVVGQLHEEMTALIDREVAAELATVQTRIMERIYQRPLYRVETAAPESTPAPVAPPRVYSVPSAPLAQEPKQAALVGFTAPVGDFVPHDKRSTRLVHRDKAPQEGIAAPATTPEAAARKPKVKIIGLHNNKQELIKREFRDVLELYLFTPDQRAKMRDSIHSGDRVLFMADFCSHMHYDTAVAAGGNVTIVKGGMPSLRDELTKIYVEEKAA